MAITQAVPKSFKDELVRGIHVFDADVFKLALYVAAATLNKDTTAYTAANEMAAAGYAAGGIVLAGISISFNGDELRVTWTDPVWTPVSFNSRGCLIYNSSKANRAVAVLDFGADIVSTNDDFTVDLPVNTVYIP
jgi:hypothetical protein